MKYDIDSALNACSRDMTALEYLYVQLYKQVCAVCYSVTGNYELAADSAQDTFARLPDAAVGYKPGTNAKAYIMKVAYNCARENRRKFGSEVSDNDTERSDGGRTEQAILNGAYIKEVLSVLDKKQRVVVMMYVYNDMSIAEIASALGIHPNSVRKRLAKAKEILGTKMGRVTE